MNEDLNIYYNKDPIKAEHNYCHRLKFSTKEDLEELRALAQDMKGWKKLTRAIIPRPEKERHVMVKKRNSNKQQQREKKEF